MRVCLALLFIFTLALSSFADVNADFDGGNKLFAQGKYTEAANTYDKIIADGSVSTALYFNLGNAEFKAGQLGRAIAAYRRAEQLSPRDPDVQGNLGFARNQVSASDAPHKNILQRALGKLTLNEWTTLAAVTVWAWLILLALREWQPKLRQTLANYTLYAGLLAFVLAGCTGTALIANHSTKSAVVVQETQAKTGPLDDSQNAFTAKDGTELTVLDERDDWLQVTDTRNRLGWIKRDAVQVL